MSSQAFECEESRAISRSQAHAESGSLQHAVITVHIELHVPVLESHVAPSYTVQL